MTVQLSSRDACSNHLALSDYTEIMLETIRLKLMSNLVTLVGGVVVQWLDYSPVTQEPSIHFPTEEKVASSN